jgi:hypothetical protein
VAIWPRKPDEPWTAVQNAVLGLLDLPAPLRVWLAADLITLSSGLGQPTGYLPVDAHKLLAAVVGDLAPRRDPTRRKRQLAAVALAVVPTALEGGKGLYADERKQLARAVDACMEQPKDARG